MQVTLIFINETDIRPISVADIQVKLVALTYPLSFPLIGASCTVSIVCYCVKLGLLLLNSDISNTHARVNYNQYVLS